MVILTQGLRCKIIKMATEPIYSIRLPYQFQGSNDQTVIIVLSSLYLPNINHVSLRLADIVQL